MKNGSIIPNGVYFLHIKATSIETKTIHSKNSKTCQNLQMKIILHPKSPDNEVKEILEK